MKNNWKQIKNELLRNGEVKREYDNMEVEFKLIDDVIKLRKSRGITQVALARKIGTTQSALSRFESGNISPTVGFIKKIAEALDAKLNIGLG